MPALKLKPLFEKKVDPVTEILRIIHLVMISSSRVIILILIS